MTLSSNLASNTMNSVNNDHGYQKDYRKACEALKERCDQLEIDNKKLSRRVEVVKRLTKQKTKDVTLLKSRLDIHGDAWRTAGPMN